VTKNHIGSRGVEAGAAEGLKKKNTGRRGGEARRKGGGDPALSAGMRALEQGRKDVSLE